MNEGIDNTFVPGCRGKAASLFMVINGQRNGRQVTRRQQLSGEVNTARSNGDKYISLLTMETGAERVSPYIAGALREIAAYEVFLGGYQLVLGCAALAARM